MRRTSPTQHQNMFRGRPMLSKGIAFALIISLFPCTGRAEGLTQRHTSPTPFILSSNVSPSGESGRLHRFWADAKYIFSSPARLQKRDLLPLGAFTLVTGGLLLLDETIHDATHSSDEFEESNEFIANFEWFGNGLYLLPAYGLTIAGGHLFHNEKLKETGFMALEAFVISGTITQGFKRLFDRRRPRHSRSADEFDGPTFTIGDPGNAFPSGHTTVAFATAAVISEQYNNPYLSASVYALAGLLGLQRIYESAHWASDVFVGATIGTLVGKTVVKLNQRRGNAVTIMPVISSGRNDAGLLLQIRF